MSEEMSALSDDLRWYVLQTYSGHEKKVKLLLEKKTQELVTDGEEKATISEITSRTPALYIHHRLIS